MAGGLACWGLFLGLFPPVFLTDEVEALERQDALYGGAVAVVFLVLPLLVVPIATGTAISAWTDRALDSQRLNLREERVSVREAQARMADDYRQRGVDGPELSTLTGTALGSVRQGRERRPGVPERPEVPQPHDARHRSAPGGAPCSSRRLASN